MTTFIMKSNISLIHVVVNISFPMKNNYSPFVKALCFASNKFCFDCKVTRCKLCSCQLSVFSTSKVSLQLSKKFNG